MPYLPIENYGIIGDTCTVALVGMNGSIDWFCFPHFDSPSIFAAILDDKKGGYLKIAPTIGGITQKEFTGRRPMSSSHGSSRQTVLVRSWTI